MAPAVLKGDFDIIRLETYACTLPVEVSMHVMETLQLRNEVLFVIRYVFIFIGVNGNFFFQPKAITHHLGNAAFATALRTDKEVIPFDFKINLL